MSTFVFYEPERSWPTGCFTPRDIHKFGVQQATDFQIYNPADAAKVTACESGRADPVDDLFGISVVDTPDLAGTS
jgi:hypothetical protein